MTTNLQKLTLFCLNHQETFTMPRSGVEVLCEQGPHVLSENYLQQKWEYCCSCQSFFARNDGEAAKEKCLVCDREIIARYLCNSCDTLAFETKAPPIRREFSLSQDGLPIPVCPCCLKSSTAPARQHDCPCLKASYKSARSTCPFCEDKIFAPQSFSHSFQPSFRRPVAYYLSNFNGKAFRAGYSETQQNALAEKDDGRFWMTVFQDDSSYLVFPSVPQWESAQNFYLVQKLFDCDYTGAGELWIVAPAIAVYDSPSGEYTIAQKGKLEVHASQTSPLAPPPLPASYSQPLVSPPPIDPSVINAEGIPEAQNRASSPPPMVEASATAQKNSLNKILLFSGAGLIALVVIIALVVSSVSSTKGQILAKLKQGQMVSPIGDSAYDIYLRSNLSDSEKNEIRNTATPVLESYGSGILTKIVNDSYDPPAAELGDLIRAYTWLDTLAPNNFYKARKQYFQGWQSYQKKDYDNARKEFTQAMDLDANWALPVNKLAMVSLRYNDYYAAQTWYQKASERDPKWIFPLINLGMLVIGKEANIRNYALAEEVANKALAIDPKKASAYYILGSALDGQGRTCEALSAYRNAVENATNTPSPGFNVKNVNNIKDRLSRRVNCDDGHY
jgi:hypothetical protein